MAVIDLNDANFEAEVTNREGFVIVDFWAPWCGPCNQMTPVFTDVSTDFAGKVHFCKLNTEDSQEIPTKLGIRSIPTLLIYKDGTVKEQLTGFQSKELLTEKLNEVMESN